MKQLTITNTKTGQGFKSQPLEDDAVDSWVAATKTNRWGKDIRWTPKKGQEDINIVDYDDADVLQEEERLFKAEYQKPLYELDGNGDPVMEEYTYMGFEEVEKTGMRPTGELDLMEEYTYMDSVEVEKIGLRPVQVLDGEGKPVFETVPAVAKTWVQLKAEYDIVIEDITVEYEAEAQEKEDRRLEIQQLKAAYTIVNGWNTMGDININFIKKFFKRIIMDMKD